MQWYKKNRNGIIFFVFISDTFFVNSQILCFGSYDLEPHILPNTDGEVVIHDLWNEYYHCHWNAINKFILEILFLRKQRAKLSLKNLPEEIIWKKVK